MRGNEFPPPDDINAKLENEIFPEYDETRFYVNYSTSDSIERNTIGGVGDGPYGIQNPMRFFVTQSFPFNPELGSVGMPNVETMRKMMDEKDLRPPRNDRANSVWQYHKYIGYGDHIERFGEIKGIDDFCKKAQVVNYEQYRALQEGFNCRNVGHVHRHAGVEKPKSMDCISGSVLRCFPRPNRWLLRICSMVQYHCICS